jgi:small subunit ribosomal protein S17
MKQTLTGNVVSAKTPHTVVVAVKSTKVHPKYLKRYTVVKKYMAHVESEILPEVGTAVKLVSCRPMSKLKKWLVQTNV